MLYLQCKNCVIMPERFRGELLTVGRYTNPASFTFLLNTLNTTHIGRMSSVGGTFEVWGTRPVCRLYNQPLSRHWSHSCRSMRLLLLRTRHFFPARPTDIVASSIKTRNQIHRDSLQYYHVQPDILSECYKTLELLANWPLPIAIWDFQGETLHHLPELTASHACFLSCFYSDARHILSSPSGYMEVLLCTTVQLTDHY